MARFALISSGLVSLVVGLLLAVTPAAADDPPLIVGRQLVTQRVELLPSGPLCWRLLQGALLPGVRDPGQGYAARDARLYYMLEGEQQIEYAGGPTRTVKAGEGFFIGNNNYFFRTNFGTVPARHLTFELTCQPFPGSAVVQFVGNTGPLAGVRSGDVPYMVTLVENTGVPGATLNNARITPGPATWYVLQGEIAQSTAAGITRYRTGDLFVPPVGTPFQETVVSSTDARALVIQLFPAGAANTLLPDLRLPSPVPAALPRTGDEVGWLGTLAMLAGALLLAAALRLRRTPH